MAFGSSDVSISGAIKSNGTADSTGGISLNRKRVAHPAVDATITVGDEATNVRAITIQLKDADGNDIAEVTPVELILYLDAGGLAFAATGGSTGIEAGTDGALLAVVAKKYFLATTEADGDLDLTWTDTGTEAAYLGLKLPNGNVIISDALTNAA